MSYAGASRPVWTAARAVALAAFGALLVGLVVRPEVALTGLWKVAIPLVPASLLVTPLAWRNVCPLATVSMAGRRLGRGRSLPRRWATVATIVGVVLLTALVPARRFLFDHDGPALAVAIGAVSLAAFGLGSAFEARSGFCNSICPVLPVERLYGQSPLVETPRARCETCTGCTAACPDLAPSRSLRDAIGTDRGGTWTTRPLGAFAAAFPGFVVGYFTSTGTDLSSAPRVYLQVLGSAAIAWGVVTAVVRAGRIPPRRVLPLLAALAVGAYYAFAAPDTAAALGFGPGVGEGLRAALLAGVAGWWIRADSRARRAVP